MFFSCCILNALDFQFFTSLSFTIFLFAFEKYRLCKVKTKQNKFKTHTDALTKGVLLRESLELTRLF